MNESWFSVVYQRFKTVILDDTTNRTDEAAYVQSEWYLILNKRFCTQASCKHQNYDMWYHSTQT